MKFLREFAGRTCLLLLPLVAYVGLWLALMFSSHLDTLTKNEEVRLKSISREVVEAMLDASEAEKAAWLRPSRGKGEAWHKNFKARSHYWGYVSLSESRHLVWVMVGKLTSTDESVYVQEIETSPIINFRAYVLYGGIVVFIPLAFLTIVGISSFHTYAKSRDDFMAAAVHDLNTPLVGLRFMIGTDDEEARVLNERLIRLVANIKDFLRLGGRRKKPECEPVDLRKAYDEAYALYREDFRDVLDGADVTLEAPEEVPPVAADELLVVQILWNLLGNELKYAAPHGPVKAVITPRANVVEFSFIDEGQGLTPREMKRIFKRYYRARRGMASGKGGFGIGLCTSREFARAMGGDLTVKANKPHGCIFTLTLPNMV